MQLVVPMAGFGERFRCAGFDRPKPLVQIEGRPMIAWVLELFPGVDDPLCLVNADHLAHADWGLEAAIRAVRPAARVVPVPAHRRGPVHTLALGLDHVDPDDDVLVSVCDLAFPWDLAHFRRWVAAARADAAVVVYRGFHPHFLRSTHYGFLREEGRWAVEIREKHVFTDDPIGQREPCSNGVYWWRSGALLARTVRAVDGDPGLAIAGEHYPAQAIGVLVDEGRDVAVYDTTHYLQWGNPEDLGEERAAARAFADRLSPPPRGPDLDATLLLPLAGLGQRFADAGYALPKPLLEVDGRPMVVSSARGLPPCARQVFVLRQDQPGLEALQTALRSAWPQGRQVVLPGATDGQARTVVTGLDEAGVPDDEPVIVGVCDTGLQVDGEAHAALLGEADVLVWTMHGHPGALARPEHYGWVDASDGRVRGVSVKVPLADPATDPAIVGVFSFRRAGDLRRAFAALLARDGRVRGELYLDSLVTDALALGLDVRVMPVRRYFGWGTPDDLRTYTYWQGFFHHWPHHPYRLQDDPAVAPEAVARLAAASAFDPPAPLPPRGSHGAQGIGGVPEEP